jgi:hypothetical protein
MKDAASVIHNTNTLFTNPYIGKNVQFADCIAYITKHGYIRRYQNSNIIGKNNCPMDILTDINIQKISILNLRYNDRVDISQNLKLFIGEDITENSYCGFEITNIEVERTDVNRSNYYGCFDYANNISNNNPYPDNKFYTYESCKSLAVNTGNNYFGLYETDQNGVGKCIVSDNSANFDITKQYINNITTVEKTIDIPLVLIGSTGDSSTNSPSITQNVSSVQFINGTLYAYDSSSNKIGFYGPTYNCHRGNNDCSAYYLQIDINGRLSVINPSSKKIINTIIYPNNIKNTNISFLKFQNSNTNIDFLPNNNLISKNNKIMNNNGLNKGDYINSSNKKFKITLTTDGVLKYAYYVSSQICRETNSRFVGNNVDNISGVAVYNIPTIYPFDNCNISSGYVSGSGRLHPYTNESYVYTNNYTKRDNFDHVGNDMTGSLGNITTEKTMSECEQKCNSIQDCSGFTYDLSNNICSTKTGCLSKLSIIPTDPAKNITLQIRRKTFQKNKYITNQQSVPQNIYSSFSSSDPITSSNNMQPIKMEDIQTTPIISSNLTPELLKNINNDILTTDNNNTEIDILNQQNKNSQGIEGMLNMNTVDSMLNDGDLINLQSKYINMCWSILAIGTVIFTIVNIKK